MKGYNYKKCTYLCNTNFVNVLNSFDMLIFYIEYFYDKFDNDILFRNKLKLNKKYVT